MKYASVAVALLGLAVTLLSVNSFSHGREIAGLKQQVSDLSDKQEDFRLYAADREADATQKIKNLESEVDRLIQKAGERDK